MVVARSAREIVGFGNWDSLVHSIDWTRALLEAEGMHLREGHQRETVCGYCLEQVLLLSEGDYRLGGW